MWTCKLSTDWVTLFAVLLWTLSGAPRVLADSYGPPQPTHWSDNRQFVLHVDDTHRILTLQQTPGPRSLTLWSIPYPQTWAPQTAYITDDGRYVVLQDQHGNLGRGKVFLFLGPGGTILRSYTLKQFLTLSEILDAGQSVSSTHWSVNSQCFIASHQTCFACVTQRGTIRCFDLATGKRLDDAIEVKQQVRNEAIVRARTWLFSSRYDYRTTGIVQAGALGDRASLPTLTSLLDFHTHAQAPETAQRGEDQDIQYRAAGALAALLKEKAAPLLEARLGRIAPDWIGSWVELYKKTGQAHYSPKILRLMQSRNPDIRRAAIGALLEGGSPVLVRQNRAWLTDPSENVRCRAIESLSEDGSKVDLPLLRIALRDKDENCDLWALRGLIRLNAPELPSLLRHYMRVGKDSWAGKKAQLELARRGDRVQLTRLVAWERSLRNHSHQKEGWATEEMDADDVCEILALRHPPGAIEVLTAAGKNPDPAIQRSALGALAMTGDAYALTRLRRFAQVGDALQRADAIHWLELCKDGDSKPLLKIAQEDEDWIVRDAAAKALRILASIGSKAR